MLKTDGIEACSSKGRTNEMVKNLKEPGEGLKEPGEGGEELGDVQIEPGERGGSRVGEVGNAYTVKDGMKVGDTASVKNAYMASGVLENVHAASIINNVYMGRVETVCDHTARNNDVGNFESPKVDKASDETTNVNHGINAGQSYADMTRKTEGVVD
ncbi:hypothetical protein QVD17_16696 [Tagetes erecta]|uniref:Uncharacterized protein n=1 Tax=Tagetes erecta TaxID=13708 RepID=A0AAD8P0U1_TARER|nr:hypothetical protein QVD17_16696 [Tagetes erecta]